MAISYLDYKAQDFASAAYLSNDAAMIAAYQADPYLSFAVRAGLAPEGATKTTHKAVRDICKTVVLGLGYGMGERTLSKRLGVSREEAHHLVKTYQEMFPKYAEWSAESIQQALLSGSQQTSYGWHHYCGGGRTSLRTIKNWPIQSCGSDILRLACILLEQEGIQVISTIHDAVVIEDTVGKIDVTVERAKEQMILASSYALLGKGRVEVDAHTVKYPDHYSDARGDRMWERIQRILKKLEEK